ncbi:alpha/beta-hydrolase [Rhizopus microsporus var. microsporus]|uniref:Alpha/beta-hydrolase n=1 Tax=Rhizopus microsporus var. microsporus TaxID=86635 RepID=A0A1X0RDL9_RHIZD|nr:alpha/beta-hydrolase [Rhizopus microsporus var. microsporus]
MLRLLILTTCSLLSLYTAIVITLCFDTPQRMVRNFKIQTSDNVMIGAWHILPTEYYEKYALREREGDLGTIFDDALKEHDTFVYFHGNALHRASPWRVEFYKSLSSKFSRSNIIAIDYRGFGDSESTPSETGLRLDAQAVLRWLNDRKVANNHISLIGHSLGTGVATTLAYDMSKAGQPPKALILQAGYTSISTLVFEYNIIPYLSLLTPLTYNPKLQDWAVSKLNHRFDSLSRIRHVSSPILILFGSKDWEIPVLNSHKLFHRAILGEREFEDLEKFVNKTITRTIIPDEATIYKHPQKIHMVEVHHADHNNLGYFDMTYQAIHDLIN